MKASLLNLNLQMKDFSLTFHFNRVSTYKIYFISHLIVNQILYYQLFVITKMNFYFSELGFQLKSHKNLIHL
jgi:hypothetical protein